MRRRLAAKNSEMPEPRTSTTMFQARKNNLVQSRSQCASIRFLLEDDQPLQTRQAGENPGSGGAAGHGQPRLRVLAAQLLEDAAGDHGIANARRGYEEDPHAPGV